MPAAPPITKFTPPRLPSTLVDRASLIARLDIGSAPVTLVMGFAGAGKTVLMTAWLDAHPERLAAWLSRDSWGTLMAAVSHTAPQPISRTTTMVEDLSQRERAVLRWLPTRLTAREIANELFISMNTLKSHLKTIYRKLDATSRADAVARAVAHGLLPATQPSRRAASGSVTPPR